MGCSAVASAALGDLGVTHRCSACSRTAPAGTTPTAPIAATAAWRPRLAPCRRPRGGFCSSYAPVVSAPLAPVPWRASAPSAREKPSRLSPALLGAEYCLRTDKRPALTSASPAVGSWGGALQAHPFAQRSCRPPALQSGESRASRMREFISPPPGRFAFSTEKRVCG